MNNFIDYKKIPSDDSAKDLILLLEKNKIHFEIEDRSQRFSLVDDPTDDFFIVRIKVEDFKTVDELVQVQSKSEVDLLGDDHYLHTFSNEDIIDTIANPEDWSRAEIKLAKNIAQQRKIDLSIKKLNKFKQKNIDENNKKAGKLLKNTSNWFILIAIFSVINSVFLVVELPIKFTLGLGISEFTNGILLAFTGKMGLLNIVVTVFISLIYVVFWYLARKKMEWALIAGVIFYGFDTILLLVFQDFLSVAVHIVIIVFILIGHIKIQRKKMRRREAEGHE